MIVEAVRRVAAWFFSSAADGGRDGHKLLIRTAATNSAARKVAERSGLQHVGTERQAFALGDGGTDDQVLYDLLATGPSRLRIASRSAIGQLRKVAEPLTRVVTVGYLLATTMSRRP